jgi:hypothetical protein
MRGMGMSSVDDEGKGSEGKSDCCCMRLSFYATGLRRERVESPSYGSFGLGVRTVAKLRLEMG